MIANELKIIKCIICSLLKRIEYEDMEAKKTKTAIFSLFLRFKSVSEEITTNNTVEPTVSFTIKKEFLIIKSYITRFFRTDTLRLTTEDV
jgi:hypothetical protein